MHPRKKYTAPYQLMRRFMVGMAILTPRRKDEPRPVLP
jgi:hypothetical protein